MHQHLTPLLLDENSGLGCCSRLVGKTQFINVPMFGLWLVEALPEQQKG